MNRAQDSFASQQTSVFTHDFCTYSTTHATFQTHYGDFGVKRIEYDPSADWRLGTHK